MTRPHDESDAEQGRPGRAVRWLRTGISCALLVAALLIVRGCRAARREAPAQSSRSQPAAPDGEGAAPSAGHQPAAAGNADPAGATRSGGEQPTPPPAPADPFQAAVRIQNLGDLQQGWLRITRQARTAELSVSEGRFQPAGEFTIGTTNVEEFTLDRAPLAVRSADRLIMHIDGQNLVVFPREHEHGLLTFRRSPAGTWEYTKQGE